MIRMTRFTPSIDVARASLSCSRDLKKERSRSMITDTSRCMMQILVKCSYSITRLWSQEVPAGSSSSSKRRRKSQGKCLGNSITTSKSEALSTSLKATRESKSQQIIRCSSTESTSQTICLNSKTVWITLCSALKWCLDLPSNIVLLSKPIRRISISIQGSLRMTSGSMLLTITMKVR